MPESRCWSLPCSRRACAIPCRWRRRLRLPCPSGFRWTSLCRRGSGTVRLRARWAPSIVLRRRCRGNGGGCVSPSRRTARRSRRRTTRPAASCRRVCRTLAAGSASCWVARSSRVSGTRGSARAVWSRPRRRTMRGCARGQRRGPHLAWIRTTGCTCLWSLRRRAAEGGGARERRSGCRVGTCAGTLGRSCGSGAAMA